MKRILTATCLLLAFRSQAIMGMPIPPNVKQCVVFLYVTDADGVLRPNGTGFFVAIRHPMDPKTLFPYLVTAGHVTRQGDSGPHYSELQVRMKHRDGTVEFLRVPLVPGGPKKTLFLPDDPTVDLAVVPLAPDQAKYEFKVIPDEFLPTEAELKALPVQEGAEVFFTGLFLQHVSDRANVPIVRFGRVAFATDEPVTWNGSPRQLLLVECSSYGGNSGAPVFYYLGPERNPGSIVVGTPVLKLAGVMMGAYQDVTPVRVLTTSPVPVTTSNLGIAAVVPLLKLRELLFGSELSGIRAQTPPRPGA